MAKLVKDAATVRVAVTLVTAGQDLILTVFNRFGAENVVNVVVSRVFISPFSNCVEHVAMYLDSFVTEGWVMESAKDIIDNLIYRNSSVFPGI